MQTLSLTIVLISLILLGTIIGIYLQSKINEMHRHMDAVYNELKLEAAVLQTKVTELERGVNDTRNNVKAISEREQITDPNIRWGK